MYCNSPQPPDENGVCPECGRVVPRSGSQSQAGSQAQAGSSRSTVDEERQYPVQHWRCTWIILCFTLLNALILAAVLAGVVWGLDYFKILDETIKEHSKIIWTLVAAIPAVYFILGFIWFVYNLFIKRYELRSKEIRLIKGFFNMTTNSTLLEALWGMKLRQNIFQRVLGTGKITLFSDDVTAPVLHINDIGSVRKRFSDLIRYQDYALDFSNVKVEKPTNADTSTHVWRYSPRDLIDETIWGVVLPLLLFGILFGIQKAFTHFTFLSEKPYLSFLQMDMKQILIAVLVFAAAYWCWWAWMFLDKICCTKYTLNNATLVKESGILYKKVDVYVLCHIRDCEMSQNLWQKMVGKVGNIILYLKWENKDASQDSGVVSTTKKDVLHGLVDHDEKFEVLKERWLRERHRRQA